jgi:hypothetical protein
MGYGWLTAAMIALVWAFSFVWWRGGFGSAVDILSWTVLSVAFVPVVVLLLTASWAYRRYGALDAGQSSGVDGPHSK